jgi:hypothetical protein
VVESEQLNQLLDARLFFKAENLQKTGAFKYRGAVHFLSNLSPQKRETGVLFLFPRGIMLSVVEGVGLLPYSGKDFTLAWRAFTEDATTPNILASGKESKIPSTPASFMQATKLRVNKMG